MTARRLSGALVVFAVAALAAACGVDATGKETASTSPVPTSATGLALTLGDVDPDSPVKKIRRFQPLADYLASHLGDFGITEGRVVIARSIEEMGHFLREGKVDVYFDSPFPTLSVQQISGSRIIARRWKDREAIYWGVVVVPADSEITSPAGLRGRVISVEKPHSTSGYILQAGTLRQRGFNLIEVAAPDEPVGPDKIGYFFARDEDNIVELLRERRVAGGALSNQELDALPPEVRERFRVLLRSIVVPRQLVSVSPDVDPALSNRIVSLLEGLDETEEGLEILLNLKKTRKFDALPEESKTALSNLQELIDLAVPSN